MNKYTKKIIIISLLGVVVALFYEYSITLYYPTTPIILFSQSETNIKLSRKPIFSRLIKMTSTSAELEVTQKTNDKKVFTVVPKSDNFYNPGQNHTIFISYLGKNIGKFEIITTPTHTSEGTKNNEYVIATQYPLAKYLPYESDSLRVDYSAPLKLRLITKLPDNEAIQEFKKYIESVSASLEGHEFVVQAQ